MPAITGDFSELKVGRRNLREEGLAEGEELYSNILSQNFALFRFVSNYGSVG
jgi:hypothetical protein